MYRLLRDFVWKWCKSHLTPLDTLPTFEEVLAEARYTQKRKDQLKTAAEEASLLPLWKVPVKCFVKDEFYTEPKFLRMISSRMDDAKVRLMPIFKAIEEEVYKTGYFVKGLRTPERIALIHDRFGMRKVYVTDYSAFETHFTRDVMNNCEMVMYRYMLQKFPVEYNLVRGLSGRNRLRSQVFKGELEAVRMSGEMNTSLGNGFSNLMFMLFAAEMTHNRVINAVVEGDDGLFELDAEPEQAFFRDMGLELKCQPAHAYDASFCGCVYNPQTLNNIGDPIKALLKLGWSKKRHVNLPEKKLRELQLALVYSACAEMRGVPIIWKACDLILSHEKQITYARARKYFHGWWEWGCPLYDKAVPPCQEDREYYADLSGISVADQLKIEAELGASYPLMHSRVLNSYIPDPWLDAWDYVE
nr:MAG: RNA-dependent RNA polymerase [Riboviria sp.]